MLMKAKMDKKGQTDEALQNFLLWMIFILIAGAAVYFLVKKLTG